MNSQISTRSFPRSRLVSRLLGAHPLTRAARVFAKSARMADRVLALGAPDVTVAGETRFDVAAPARLTEAGRALRARLGGRPVFTLASVVAGEEPVYERATAELVAREDRPLVIWVPRAPELFGATVERLRRLGLRTAVRTEAYDDELTPRLDLADTQVLVGDSFGEMFFYLAAADAVSVGGGFVEKGAHNVIEPLSLGKPVVTGPQIATMEFPGIEARDAGVLTICDQPDRLAEILLALRGTPAERLTEFTTTYRGATARILAEVERHMNAEDRA